MRKIIALLFFIFCLFIIYKVSNQNRINYVSISDINNIYNYNDYLKEYLNDCNRLGTFITNFNNIDILSIYKDIINNRTIRVDNSDYYFKKVLRESDFVVVNVGMNEIINNYNKFDMNINKILFQSIYSNIKLLVKEIKKYAQSKIIFIGYYNPTNYYDANVDELFYKMDRKLNKLMQGNSIIYVSIYELIKGNDYIDKKGLINKEGYKKISNSLIFYLE